MRSACRTGCRPAYRESIPTEIVLAFFDPTSAHPRRCADEKASPPLGSRRWTLDTRLDGSTLQPAVKSGAVDEDVLPGLDELFGELAPEHDDRLHHTRCPVRR